VKVAGGHLPTVVAIDGPAGAGKSTVARRVAEELGLSYLDTGAMYRAVGFALTRDGVDLDDAAAVAARVASVPLVLEPQPSGVASVLLEGSPVGERIRTPEAGEAASRVASVPAVRRRLVALQQDFGHRHGAVLEGRDIGTVVFPETPHKFFLDATARERARRRTAERRTQGEPVDLEAVAREIESRDARDRARDHSPLRHDETYTVIDTTGLSLGEVVEKVVGEVRRRS
jgi:cytidylate kinase